MVPLGQKSENFCGATQIDEKSSARRCAITHLSLVTGEKPVGAYWVTRSARPRQSIQQGRFCRHHTAGGSLGETRFAYSSASSVSSFWLGASLTH